MEKTWNQKNLRAKPITSCKGLGGETGTKEESGEEGGVSNRIKAFVSKERVLKKPRR